MVTSGRMRPRRRPHLVSDTLHKIKTVPVDANDHSTGTSADDKTLGGKDVAAAARHRQGPDRRSRRRADPKRG